MFKPIKSIIVEEDYGLILFFEDGCKRQLKMNKFLDTPPFDKLKDYNMFKLATPSFDTVSWPCNIDIDPEILIQESSII